MQIQKPDLVIMENAVLSQINVVGVKSYVLIIFFIFQDGRHGCHGDYMFALKSSVLIASGGHK